MNKNVSNEREVVINVLMNILEEGGFNNIALHKALESNNSLTVHQKAFVTEAVNGVLRNLILIDYIINSIATLNTEGMRPFIRNALRAAVYQLKFMNSPKPFAVCNETVALIKKRKMDSLSGFVNGVLRNILRPDGKIVLPGEAADPEKYLSIKYSNPLWLIKMWVKQFGYEETKKMCEINNTPPELTLCVNTLKTTADELQSALTHDKLTARKSGNFDNVIKTTGLNAITKLPSFAAGDFHIMDESAMFAVSELEPQPGSKILDICAAPGGKSFYAAYLMKNKGEVTANDIHPHKLTLISEGARRLKINIIKTVMFDAETENSKMINMFDKVLVDAPCTGYGVIRKKPDIWLAKTPDSQVQLAKLQQNILAQAAKYVKPQGTLVYSTCTLTRDENENNALWFSRKFPFMMMKEKTILPQHYGSDGFYIAVFRKNK